MNELNSCGIKRAQSNGI